MLYHSFLMIATLSLQIIDTFHKGDRVKITFTQKVVIFLLKSSDFYKIYLQSLKTNFIFMKV